MIRIADSSSDLKQYLASPPPLDRAVELVLDADRKPERPGFNLARTQIVQLASSRGVKPPLYCIFPVGRDDRPFTTGETAKHEDPISPEAARSAQRSYFELRILNMSLLLLANPFGYAPRCATWSSMEPIEQAAAGTPALPWRVWLEVLLAVCQALGGDIVGFNALVGNSLRRLHFVTHRPPFGIGPYALMTIAARLKPDQRRAIAHIRRGPDYPLDVWRFAFDDFRESAATGAALLDRWSALGGPQASATISVALEDGAPALYVVPRNRLLCPFGWPGMAAVMEIMGAGVSSRADFIGRVRGGDWGHANFWRALASLSPREVTQLY